MKKVSQHARHRGRLYLLTRSFLSTIDLGVYLLSWSLRQLSLKCSGVNYEGKLKNNLLLLRSAIPTMFMITRNHTLGRGYLKTSWYFYIYDLDAIVSLSGAQEQSSTYMPVVWCSKLSHIMQAYYKVPDKGNFASL